VSEPDVVADFNAQNHCTNYLEPAVSSGCELESDNPVLGFVCNRPYQIRIRGPIFGYWNAHMVIFLFSSLFDFQKHFH
jgi:hypothetical protein